MKYIFSGVFLMVAFGFASDAVASNPGRVQAALKLSAKVFQQQAAMPVMPARGPVSEKRPTLVDVQAVQSKAAMPIIQPPVAADQQIQDVRNTVPKGEVAKLLTVAKNLEREILPADLAKQAPTINPSIRERERAELERVGNDFIVAVMSGDRDNPIFDNPLISQIVNKQSFNISGRMVPGPALLIAIKNSDVKMVEKLLNIPGIDLNRQTNHGLYPLKEAITHLYDAFIDQENYSKRLKNIKLLLEHRADASILDAHDRWLILNNFRMLGAPVVEINEILKLLVDNGCQVNKETLEYVLLNCPEEVCKFVINLKGVKFFPEVLIAYCYNPDATPETADILLQKGIKVNFINEFDMSALDYSLNTANYNMMMFLLENKADFFRHENNLVSKLNGFLTYSSTADQQKSQIKEILNVFDALLLKPNDPKIATLDPMLQKIVAAYFEFQKGNHDRLRELLFGPKVAGAVYLGLSSKDLKTPRPLTARITSLMISEKDLLQIFKSQECIKAVVEFLQTGKFPSNRVAPVSEASAKSSSSVEASAVAAGGMEKFPLNPVAPASEASAKLSSPVEPSAAVAHGGMEEAY